MGESAETGVVDHKGRVFSGDSGTGVHAGLYVCDGAVLPTSIGVNPFLTISAIGERMVAHLARDRGWILDNASRRRRHGDRPRRPGLRFTERMSGRFEPLAGAGGWSPLAFVVTIETPDLGAMLHTPEHEAGITGTVEAPGLDPEPLTVLGGHFRLLYRDPDRPAERRMRYSMVLRASGGTCYFLDGLKYLADEPGVDIWSDSTTLHYRVHGGESADGPLLGTGRLTIGTADLLAQLRTLEVTGAPTAREAHHHLLQFLRFFSCSLLEVYRAGGRAPSGPRRSREALPRRD
jgi:cholesterol oxidase